MKKLLMVMAATFVMVSAVYAQNTTSERVKPFSHLDLALAVGSTGIGFDFQAPLSRMVDIRVGGDFFPRFVDKGDYKVQVGDDAEKSESRFTQLQELMAEVTGIVVDDEVTMNKKITMNNFKFLVDVKPFHNKHWRLTAGFYWGSKTVATAENDITDMASLLAMSIYNEMYINAKNDDPIMSFNGTDIYYPYLAEIGSMGVKLGCWKHDGTHTDVDGSTVEHKAGDPYRMTPDENSMVSAKARVNTFKPYLGFGYGGRLLKNNDAWNISFDCGAMFWGGSPSIVTHDGTDLVNDIDGIKGRVGDYIKLAKILKVFPVINARLAYRLF